MEPNMHKRTRAALVTAVLCAAAVAAPPAPPPNPPAIARFLTIDINAPANYARPALPAYFDARVAVNTPAADPITDKGATLGRVLFYDKSLSVNNTVACASCHAQSTGFAATTPFSAGFLGQKGTFHAMRLANIEFYRGSGFFWNKRAPTVEAQALQPIVSATEMGYDSSNGGLPALLVKMAAIPYYPELFKAVFGDPSITAERIGRALAQFERSMISADSRWDQGFAKVFDPALPDRGLARDLPGFTAQENAGRRIFMLGADRGGMGCAGCHEPPSFALRANARGNGLDAGESVAFKAPSLKNIAEGQPMMHDGRFTRFAQVVAHYNLGVNNGPALDPALRAGNGQVLAPNRPQAELDALVAFLKTLDDPAIRRDARFATPFRN
jgi:cytochrome c peroxidase